MKNPFEKKDSSVLIASVAVGAVVVGSAAAYLMLTDKGAGLRKELNKYWQKAQELFGKKPEHHEPYHPVEKHKAPKTDRKKLLHGDILHHGSQPAI
jgi:hypothetical protein